MYYACQTLRNVKTNQLARLAPGKGNNSTWNWDKTGRAGTRFVDESGKVFFANMKDFTHISDEWGNPYANNPPKGHHVDVTAKKFLVSPQKLAGMRTRALNRVRKSAEVFCEKLVGAMLNPPTTFDKSSGCEQYHYEDKCLDADYQNSFQFTVYKSFDGSNQFFTPNVGRYFCFTNYFTRYLVRTGWRVTVIKKHGCGKGGMFVTAFTAERGGKTLYWSHMMDSSLNLAEIQELH